MTKILPVIFIFSLLTLTNCSSLPDKNDHEIVRFALREDYVASWEERSDGIEVHLNEKGQHKLIGITRTHPGSEMEIYAGRVLLTSETIHSTLRGDNLFVSVDDDIRDCALAQMPHSKKADS